MKQILTLTFLLIVFCHVNAQQLTYQKPDYDLIKKEIQDSSSTFYYPKLMSRLTQYDTTLSADDYRHLYYGSLVSGYNSNSFNCLSTTGLVIL
ncbi:MAG: hypothetical protein BGO29_14480 [Bacteroidales bacterium 36-12]|nr:MAG: hypothetical protein BGO29_14480 [Bacteroidales bacterium 36-12]